MRAKLLKKSETTIAVSLFYYSLDEIRAIVRFVRVIFSLCDTSDSMRLDSQGWSFQERPYQPMAGYIFCVFCSDLKRQFYPKFLEHFLEQNRNSQYPFEPLLMRVLKNGLGSLLGSLLGAQLGSLLR